MRPQAAQWGLNCQRVVPHAQLEQQTVLQRTVQTQQTQYATNIAIAATSTQPAAPVCNRNLPADVAPSVDPAVEHNCVPLRPAVNEPQNLNVLLPEWQIVDVFVDPLMESSRFDVKQGGGLKTDIGNQPMTVS